MPADRDKGKSKANNPTGSNQHSSRPLLEQYPDLPQWIQGYIDDGIKQPDMPRELSDDHGITVNIECIIKNQNLRTTRHSGLTDVDKGAAILAVTQEDPLARWGGWKIKEKLSLETIHVPRMASKFIDNMRGVLDRDAADMRKPGAKKNGCVDGHEKILLCMGIAVWGIINKYAREELNLWAVPDARTADVPPALYLLMTTSDMGSETGGLAAAQTLLRQIYLPDLPLDSLPAHRSVKSVYNITRERGWCLIWEKELANVKYAYETGKISAGFHPEDPIHQGVSLWLWAKLSSCVSTTSDGRTAVTVSASNETSYFLLGGHMTRWLLCVKDCTPV
ncbi:hypothetical protein B0H14DRAFT_2572268 [Mycena olivaceomarginata]|nr:hypothetical protein B0H14DRAFT_2572268 [Mycena olivaceomarginata]